MSSMAGGSVLGKDSVRRAFLPARWAAVFLRRKNGALPVLGGSSPLLHDAEGLSFN